MKRIVLPARHHRAVVLLSLLGLLLLGAGGSTAEALTQYCVDLYPQPTLGLTVCTPT
jgi:hypothetical protein